jgi:hypothetical protein
MGRRPDTSYGGPWLHGALPSVPDAQGEAIMHDDQARSDRPEGRLTPADDAPLPGAETPSGNGLSTGLQPSGTIPGGGPGAGVGSIGTGGGSTGNAATGNVCTGG